MGTLLRLALALALVVLIVDVAPTFANHLRRCVPERAVKERYVRDRRTDQADYVFGRLASMYQQTVHDVNEGCLMPALQHAGRESAFFAGVRSISHSNVARRFLVPQDRYEYIAAAVLWLCIGTGVFYLLRDWMITASAERLKARKIEAKVQQAGIKGATAQAQANAQHRKADASYLMETPADLFKPKPMINEPVFQ